MGDTLESIPVIDFSVYSLSEGKPDLKSTAFQTLVDNINKALRTIGFFYVVNTGFPQEKVSMSWGCCRMQMFLFRKGKGTKAFSP